MKKSMSVFVVLGLLFSLFGGISTAQQQLVSGNMKKLNGFCRIAINPDNGNGLIVWSQGNAKKNTYGRIYAAELTRQTDGSYVVGQPFLISSSKGSNQRPCVAYLKNVGKYLVVWDTSVYDLSVYVDNRPFPLPAAKILARTYTPSAAATSGPAGALGNITTLNDPEYEYNSICNVVPIYTNETTPANGVKDRVFVTFFCSDEEQGSKVGPFTAGMYGTTWEVGAGSVAAVDRLAAAGDMSRVNGKQMADWTVSHGMGITIHGFYYNKKVYAAGAHQFWNMGGVTGKGGIYKIDPNALAIDQFFSTGVSKANKYPIDAFGQVLPLNGVVASPGAGLRIVGLSNVIYNLISIDISLAETSLKNLGSISKKPTEVVDQRLFKIAEEVAVGSLINPAAKKSNVYTLYHTKKGQFKHRNLSLDLGEPSGVSKTVLKIRKKKLHYMSVDTYGKDVLLTYSEKANKKKYRVYFYKFTVK